MHTNKAHKRAPTRPRPPAVAQHNGSVLLLASEHAHRATRRQLRLEDLVLAGEMGVKVEAQSWNQLSTAPGCRSPLSTPLLAALLAQAQGMNGTFAHTPLTATTSSFFWSSPLPPVLPAAP